MNRRSLDFVRLYSVKSAFTTGLLSTVLWCYIVQMWLYGKVNKISPFSIYQQKQSFLLECRLLKVSSIGNCNLQCWIIFNDVKKKKFRIPKMHAQAKRDYKNIYWRKLHRQNLHWNYWGHEVRGKTMHEIKRQGSKAHREYSNAISKSVTQTQTQNIQNNNTKTSSKTRRKIFQQSRIYKRNESDYEWYREV